MKNFKLNGITYEVPTSWDEVTLAQQVQVSSDAKEIKVKELQKLAVLSGYCNIPIDVMRKTSMNKLNNLWKHLTFLNDKLPEDPITEFEYKGEKYSILSSIIDNEFQDYISIQTILEQNKNDIWKSLPTMIAILAKKKGESLDDYDLIKRAKHFEGLSVSIANRIAVFFSSIMIASKIHSQLYLNRDKIIQQKVNECESTVNKLAGRGWRFRLLAGILRMYLRSIKKLWQKYSNTLPINP